MACGRVLGDLLRRVSLRGGARCAVAVTLSVFVLSWDVPPAEEYIVKWRVYRSINGGSYALLKTVSSCSASVTVYSGERRCFKVKAVNVLNQASPYSTEVCLEGG